jgi:hypothetical protein
MSFLRSPPVRKFNEIITAHSFENPQVIFFLVVIDSDIENSARSVLVAYKGTDVEISIVIIVISDKTQR